MKLVVIFPFITIALLVICITLLNVAYINYKQNKIIGIDNSPNRFEFYTGIPILFSLIFIIYKLYRYNKFGLNKIELLCLFIIFLSMLQISISASKLQKQNPNNVNDILSGTTVLSPLL
jgi:phosphatidylserine synthase